ncbi:SPOR domain-containing protein [Lysobacter ciconiae]|uniref:SPOR domain-containing protein n=1 Tax=Novilysobacter ciconiae TaxID=2781022 RepID=A0A7S6UFM3_9GAMM|nr:SPOR domain-containing protein [Lysobacter ciconiae]QOW19406.1 SPOR domain-containing protein [Lysobacter ciconiae]
MAARRGKSQARRNQGNSGMPGWAWMILGILITIVAILLLPKVLKSDGDGFFRPQPNPDAQPAPVAVDDSVVGPGPTGKPPASDGPKYDFYTLLPGKEVAVSDAELAATERAEEQRAEALRAAAALRGETPAAAVARNPDAADPALPTPVSEEPTTTAPTPTTPAASTAATTSPAATPAAAAAEPRPVAAAADGSRYLLQAGAFQASGQAEELKAQLAMMGLSARVEPAQINGNTVYRVRMGPYGSAGDLADAKRKLASSGVSAMAIKAQ